MLYTIYIDKLKGSHYEIGKRKGEIVLSRYGAGHIDEQREHRKQSYLYRHLSRNFDIHSPENAERANVARKILERAHPGLLEEIKGFGDGIGKTYEEALAMTASSGGGNKGCSHFIKNGLHAHNYDDSPDDIDSHLLLTYVEGDYSHVGFQADILAVWTA